MKNKNSENFITIIPTNLPEQLTSLIGRESEIGAIQNLLKQKEINLITLTGLGGVGKTSLAMQVAHLVREEFSGGVYFISLASLTKKELIPIEIGRILKVEQTQNKKIIESIKEFLLGRRILLVLDNFEHLIEGASCVQELLQSSSNLKIIVTSREPLRLRNEQIYPVGALDNEHALELFIKRAQSLNPNLFISSEDKHSILELCKRLDGLPLAIELAALRTKLFSPSALLARLQPDLQSGSRILNLFSSGSRDLPARQQSLRNMIAWSYELLEEKEKKVFRAASIFPAGFQIDALAILLNMNEDEILEIISSLVDKNLIKPSLEKHLTAYFTMVEMIREFAWGEIIKLGELTELKNAYVDLYLALTQQADETLRNSQTADLFAHFDDEFANINLALEICVTSPAGSKNWVKGYQILHCFYLYWMLHQYIYINTEYIDQARKSIDDFSNADPKSAELLIIHKANIYSLSGSLAWLQGDYKQAVGLHETAYSLYSQIHNEKGMLEALNNIGSNTGATGDFQKGLEYLEKSNVLCQKLGDRWAEMRNLFNMGFYYQYAEHSQNALEAFEKALKIAQEMKDEYFITIINYGISWQLIRHGNYDEALLILKSNLEMSQNIQGVLIMAQAYGLYARANILLKKQEAAVNVTLEAIALSEKVTDIDVKVELLYTSIYILLSMALYQEAAQLIGALQNSKAAITIQQNPFDRREFEKFTQRIQSAITTDEFESSKLAGSKLTLDSALAIVAEIFESPSSVEDKENQPLQLTPREQEVLALIAQGLTNEQISNELVVVLKTVEKHVAGIFRKLGVKNRTEAAAWALERDIKSQ